MEDIVKKYDENSDKVISKEEWLKSSALDELRRIAIDGQVLHRGLFRLY